MLRQKKEQAEADHKREYEEKRAAAAAKQKAKEEREAALAGEAAAAASTTGTIGKFKAPKNIPVSCPAVPVQKNQVCVFFKHVECAAMAYNPSALGQSVACASMSTHPTMYRRVPDPLCQFSSVVVISVCAKRTGAVSQAFERMHNTLSYKVKT